MGGLLTAYCQQGAELAVFPHQDPAPGGALAKFEGIAPSAQGAIIYPRRSVTCITGS
jgi:predicted enzyme related to lactoylglutathione lyase